MPVTIDEVIAEVAPAAVPAEREEGAEPSEADRRALVRNELARMQQRARRLHAD